MTKKEEIEKWAEKEIECHCGGTGELGDGEGLVYGCSGSSPCVWMGCDNCGAALGYPLGFDWENTDLMKTVQRIRRENTRLRL